MSAGKEDFDVKTLSEHSRKLYDVQNLVYDEDLLIIGGFCESVYIFLDF